MVLSSPFRLPDPKPQPFHEVLMESFDDYDQNAIALEEEGDTGKRFTFGQVRRLVGSLAYSLRDRYGFQKGDVVLSFMENRIEFPILFLGVSALGGITSGANPLYTHEEVIKQTVDSGAKYIVTSEQRVPVVLQALRGMEDPKRIRAIFVIDPTSKIDSFKSRVPLCPFDDLYRASVPLSNGRPVFPIVQIDPKKDPVLLPYSSGTTGLPKGVLLSHHNLQCILYKSHPLGVFSVATHGDVGILFLPFFHVAGFMGLVSALHNGATAVIMRQFDSKRYLAAVQRYKVSGMACVPSVLVFLAKDPSVDTFDLSHVRTIGFGAAPAGKELIEAVMRRFPNLETIIQGYGLTETAGLGTMTPKMPASEYPLGSCGMCTPYNDLKVMSIDGKNQELGPTHQGEIWLRGPSIMLGYHNNEKATRECLDDDGWLRTGDIGYYDHLGHVYIVDRLKELIKYKAFQVAPAELEDTLLKHPAVQDVAVIGIPDTVNPDVGELPTAYVVLKAGHDPTEETARSIKSIVAQHLAPFKHLRGGVIYVSQIPKGGTGKVLRRVLKDIKSKVFAADSPKQRSKM